MHVYCNKVQNKTTIEYSRSTTTVGIGSAHRNLLGAEVVQQAGVECHVGLKYGGRGESPARSTVTLISCVIGNYKVISSTHEHKQFLFYLVLHRCDSVGGVSPVHSGGESRHIFKLEVLGQLLEVLGVVGLLNSLGAAETGLLLGRGGGGELVNCL